MTCIVANPIAGSAVPNNAFLPNACNDFPLDVAPSWFAAAVSPAMGWLPDGSSCGTCIRISNGNGTNHIMAQIVDKCGDTSAGVGELHISDKAWMSLFGQAPNGPQTVSYAQATCDSIAPSVNDGHIRYRFKPGSLAGGEYLGLAVDNHMYPIASVQVRDNASFGWEPCIYGGDDNDFCSPRTGAVTGLPFEVNITGAAWDTTYSMVDTITSIPPECCAMMSTTQCEDECMKVFFNSTRQLHKLKPTNSSECRPLGPVPPPTPLPPSPPPSPLPPTPLPVVPPCSKLEADPCDNPATGLCTMSNCCQNRKKPSDGSKRLCYDPLPCKPGSCPPAWKPDTCTPGSPTCGWAFPCADGQPGYGGFCYCPAPTLELYCNLV